MTTVAVYGTLKRGFGNHYLLEQATYLGKAVSGSPFQMFCVGFPVLLPPTKDAPGLPVEVELYEVTRDQLARLDRLESNGRLYQRKRHRFRPQWRSGSKRAWVYIGKSFQASFLRKVPPSGSVYVWNGAVR